VELERNKNWRGLLKYAKHKKVRFNHVNWATTFSKLGRFRKEARDIVSDSRFKTLVAGLEVYIMEGYFGAQAIANIVHTLGAMGVRSGAIPRYVEDEAQRIAAEGNPQATSNILYAFAKLGEKDATQWFEELERKSVVQKLVLEGRPQAISNVIWARATLRLKGVSLAGFIDTREAAEYLAREGTLQATSNVLWALATLGVEARHVACAVDGKYFVQKLVSARPQDISITLWALATMGLEAKNIVSVIESMDIFRNFGKEWKPQEMSNTLWALATIGVKARNLVRTFV